MLFVKRQQKNPSQIFAVWGDVFRLQCVIIFSSKKNAAGDQRKDGGGDGGRKKKREYVPQRRSGGYAVLLTLYKETQVHFSSFFQLLQCQSALNLCFIIAMCFLSRSLVVKVTCLRWSCRQKLSISVTNRSLWWVFSLWSHVFFIRLRARLLLMKCPSFIFSVCSLI